MLPRRLQIVDEKLKNGHFRSGFQELEKVYDSSNPLDRVFMAEFLLRMEGADKAQTLARQILETTNIHVSVQARACAVLALSLVRVNLVGEVIKLLERAVHLATKAGDHDLLCKAQIELLVAKFNLFGPTSLGTLPAEVWRNVRSSGDPSLFSLLHCRFGTLEGLRGALDVARRHVDIATVHLRDRDNPYIGCLIANLAANLALLAADPHDAIINAQQSLELARRAGDHLNEFGALSNLCQISIALGSLDQAARYLALAEPLANRNSLMQICLCDNRAQLQLLKGELDDCEVSVAALESLSEEAELRTRSYTALEAVTTRVRLLQKRHLLDAALALAREGAAASDARGATPLKARFNIQCADLLADLGRLDEAAQALGHAEEAANALSVESLAIRAELDCVRGKVLYELGAKEAANRHFDRAIRVNTAISHTAARAHVEASRLELEERHAKRPQVGHSASESSKSDNATGPLAADLQGIESAAYLLVFANRPEVLGLEAYELLASSGLAESVALVANEGSLQHIVKKYHPHEETSAPTKAFSIPVGKTVRQDFVLVVKPIPTLAAQSYVMALATIVRAAVASEEMRRDNLRRNSVWPAEDDSEQEGALFGSQRMHQVYWEARKVAKSDLTILFTGETGVGKEVLAREIHRQSLRADQDFQPIVCAGMTGGLLESQLFGHRKGSFTGAIADFPGVIRGAQGGTLFLDEIGELTTELQIKLLRFLESKEIHPLGELRPLKVDVRIIAATNADLQQMVHDGKFREDLFYRLNVSTFNIPPLRERREEIPSLMQRFLAAYSQQNHKPMPKVSDEASEYLLLYRWPGNVRELRNEMERLAGTVDAGGTIWPHDLKPQILSARKTSPSGPGLHELAVRTDQALNEAVDQLEKEMIRRVLNGYKGNLADAARALGITRKGLYYKRQRFGML